MKCVEVVARLVSQPQLGTLVMGMLEARDRTGNTEKEESTRWHSTYCYLDKISKDWCTEWMIKIAQSKGCPELNLDILNRVDMKDIGHIKRLFFFLIAASPSTKLRGLAWTSWCVHRPWLVAHPSAATASNLWRPASTQQEWWIGNASVCMS